MEHLQFAPGSGCVGKNDLILRPAANGVHCSLYWSHSRNWNMFFVVAEIGNVRLKRCAFAKILRLNLAKIDTPARCYDPTLDGMKFANKRQEDWVADSTFGSCENSSRDQPLPSFM